MLELDGAITIKKLLSSIRLSRSEHAIERWFYQTNPPIPIKVTMGRTKYTLAYSATCVPLVSDHIFSHISAPWVNSRPVRIVES